MSLAMHRQPTPVLLHRHDRPASPRSSTSPPSTPLNINVAAIAKGIKRKRPTSAAPVHDTPSSGTEMQKKKKTSRACIHCQRAHLTCDDARPCQRCVKKGIADSCTEGHRKKAKYLLDDDELENLKRSKQSGNYDTDAPSLIPIPINEVTSEPVLNMPFDPSYPFGSEATNLEYSMLSAILGNAQEDQMYPPQPSTYSSLPSSRPVQGPAPAAANNLNPSPNSYPATERSPWSQNTASAPAPSGIPHPHPSPSRSGSYGHQTATPVDPNIYPPLSDPNVVSGPGAPPNSAGANPPFSQPRPDTGYPARSTSFLRTNSHPPYLSESPVSAEPVDQPLPLATSNASAISQMRIADVYRNIIHPYDYTQGYHFLMQYLQHNFDKNDILRVVRALAIFRPSLIAMQMPLTEEDEVFVEKCFQRSLIELEKLISFSGTPTVVWRRTGEICLAGVEFSMLTEWSHHELVGQRKFIYEIFERQSVVEYWEKFAAHAFENATQSVYTHCVLLKPSGEPVPCAFCFSVRRDIFDLPSLVIGQWLPLLG